MADREPEPWQSIKSAPLLTMQRERGNVTVWALGDGRFDVVAPGDSHEIRGFHAARALAHVLAEQLGAPVDMG